MQLQRLIWLDVTRPERQGLLAEPVPEETRAGYSRALLGMLVVFGAAMPLGMFSPRFAALAWAAMIPARVLVARIRH